jgi:hypothetical protein
MAIKNQLVVRLSLLAALLGVAYVFVLDPYLDFLVLNAAYSRCKSIESVILHGGKPGNDIELIQELSLYALHESDREQFLQISEYRSRGDAELLRTIKRDVFSVVSPSGQCAVAYCVIPSLLTDWSCSAELHVDPVSGSVTVVVCGKKRTKVTGLDGYAVLSNGGVIRIPDCKTTVGLAKFLFDGAD